MKKKKLFIPKCILISLVALLIILALGSSFLLFAYKYCVCFLCLWNIVRYFLKVDDNTWLSVAATLFGAVISAIPGVICGVLALLQTQRLHKLEMRSHRPVLEVAESTLKFAEIDRTFVNGNLPFEILLRTVGREQSGLYEAEKQLAAWWIDLEVIFISKNEISVQDMKIESVTITFPDVKPAKSYELSLVTPNNSRIRIRDFHRAVQSGGIEYKLLYCLNSFKLKPADAKNAFEDVIRQFCYISESQDPTLMHMELDVHMEVSFEYREHRDEKCMLKIVFDAEGDKTTEDQRDIVGGKDKTVSELSDFIDSGQIIRKKSHNAYISYGA